jgi:hypothetical protein
LEERLHRAIIDISLSSRVTRQFWKPRNHVNRAFSACLPRDQFLGRQPEAKNETAPLALYTSRKLSDLRKPSFLENHSTNSTSTGTSM